MALPPNAVINTVYVDHFVQVGQAAHTGWYEYSPFSTLLPPVQANQLQLPQNPQLENMYQQSKSKLPVQKVRPKSTVAERTYYCEECGASFSNSSNLKSHSRIHSGERPYICEECGMSFVQSSNLKAHKRIHSGERPYMCSECGQTFSRSSHLTGHKRTHTGERPYICGICRDSFVTSTHLRNHMRKHTGERPFSCHLCDAAFSQKAYLLIHQRIHSGERPYKCGECSAAFRSKGDLRSHRKLHTDDRPYACWKSGCGKLFKTNQYLQKHLKKCGAPPSGKKRGRPRKLTIGDSVALSLSKKSLNRSGKLRGRGRGKKGHPKIRPTRITRHTKFSEEEHSIDDCDLDEIELMPKIEDDAQIYKTINENILDVSSVLSNGVHFLGHTNSFNHNIIGINDDSLEVSHMLPSMKVDDDNFENIDTSEILEHGGHVDVNSCLHIENVEHIEHMPIEGFEKIVRSSHY